MDMYFKVERNCKIDLQLKVKREELRVDEDFLLAQNNQRI